MRNHNIFEIERFCFIMITKPLFYVVRTSAAAARYDSRAIKLIYIQIVQIYYKPLAERHEAFFSRLNFNHSNEIRFDARFLTD